jgi:signal transduction histidine kinase
VSKPPPAKRDRWKRPARGAAPRPKEDIELASELSPLYLGVLADRDMLLQAAINLLSNAIKYTHSGGRVTLRSRMVDDQIRFEVQDTGVGLSEEDCQRVFEKFYRVKDKTWPGTGLGLPWQNIVATCTADNSRSAVVEVVRGAVRGYVPTSGQLT